MRIFPNAADMFFLFYLWCFCREGRSKWPMCYPGLCCLRRQPSACCSWADWQMISCLPDLNHCFAMWTRAEPKLHDPMWGLSWAYMANVVAMAGVSWTCVGPMSGLYLPASFLIVFSLVTAAAQCVARKSPWHLRHRRGCLSFTALHFDFLSCDHLKQCRLLALQLLVAFFSLQAPFSFNALCKLVTEQLFHASLRWCFRWAWHMFGVSVSLCVTESLRKIWPRVSLILLAMAEQ